MARRGFSPGLLYWLAHIAWNRAGQHSDLGLNSELSADYGLPVTDRGLGFYREDFNGRATYSP